MKEYLSIGEIAEIFNMDVQLLRHYDAKGLLVPEIRNKENNRRFYHFDQIYPLATIRYLRKLGYPLSKIEKFVNANGLRENLETLIDQAQTLQRQCNELNVTIQIIQNKVDFTKRERAVSSPGKVFIKEYPAVCSGHNEIKNGVSDQNERGKACHKAFLLNRCANYAENRANCAKEVAETGNLRYKYTQICHAAQTLYAALAAAQPLHAGAA